MLHPGMLTVAWNSDEPAVAEHLAASPELRILAGYTGPVTAEAVLQQHAAILAHAAEFDALAADLFRDPSLADDDDDDPEKSGKAEP